eukprot:1863118-Prymnesium_polylepis.1
MEPCARHQSMAICGPGGMVHGRHGCMGRQTSTGLVCLPLIPRPKEKENRAHAKRQQIDREDR